MKRSKMNERMNFKLGIRGKTLNGLELRIPVFFDDEDPEMTYLGVATVINLNK